MRLLVQNGNKLELTKEKNIERLQDKIKEKEERECDLLKEIEALSAEVKELQVKETAKRISETEKLRFELETSRITVERLTKQINEYEDEGKKE